MGFIEFALGQTVDLQIQARIPQGPCHINQLLFCTGLAERAGDQGDAQPDRESGLVSAIAGHGIPRSRPQ